MPAANTLQGTINWAQTYIEYSPLTAGLGQEPAITVASIIRNTMMTAPMTWSWNRKEDVSKSTQANVQDYTYTLTDFGFLEKVSLIDPKGQIFEMKDVLNTAALSKGGSVQRPQTCCVITNNPGTQFTIRFMGIPDQVYTIVLTYQILPIQFQAFTVTSAGLQSGGQTTYQGIFNPASFPVGSIANISGFITNAGNNGSFLVVSVTPTALVVINSGGVTETPTIPAQAVNENWGPIPDSYSDIYNNLFLGEAFAAVDDARSQIYRQRGVVAFLAKQEGLTDMQKNIFAAQWMAQGREWAWSSLKLQQGVQASGI
jgi:hypothetical protein